MPNLRLHGAFRKILNVILCACLVLQSSSVPLSVYSIQASSLPPQNANEDLPQAESQTPNPKLQIPNFTPAPLAQSASQVSVATAIDTNRSPFIDTEIGFQFQPVPPPTLSGLPDPSTAQIATLRYV